MLTIIHGSDITASRKYFLDEKNKTTDAVLLDADQVNLTDLAQLFEGGGLFGETKYLFIEQLLSKKKKSTELTEILSYLEKNANEHTIIIWEGKDLDQGTLKAVKNANVKAFKLPQTLFQLLDALQPGNGKTLIALFHQTIQNSEAEMIFFMLVRQIRILLALSDNTNPIDEVKRIQPWQKNKLESQAKRFDLTHLLDLYDKLFQLELGQKTGGLSLSLTAAIDFFLLEV